MKPGKNSSKPQEEIKMDTTLIVPEAVRKIEEKYDISSKNPEGFAQQVVDAQQKIDPTPIADTAELAANLKAAQIESKYGVRFKTDNLDKSSLAAQLLDMQESKELLYTKNDTGNAQELTENPTPKELKALAEFAKVLMKEHQKMIDE